MEIDGEDVHTETMGFYDDLAHQGCYIFQAPQPSNENVSLRPKKKRKISKSTQADDSRSSFQRLLAEQETIEAAKLRSSTFQRLWAEQQFKIDGIIARIDDGSLRDIVHFVKEAGTEERNRRLPTGLVIVGKDSNVQNRLLGRWNDNRSANSADQLIQLETGQASNISSALKTIVKTAISSSEGNDGYLVFLSKYKKLISTNFDLELLQRYATDNGIEKFIISILDIESFDIGVLSELIAILTSWADRMQFVLLIGIATTVELFETRLSKSTIRLLDPKIFNLSEQSGRLYEIYETTQSANKCRMYLGPAAANILLERSKDQDTTPESFSRSIKYAYMSHFFANPLSLLLASDQDLDKGTSSALSEAIRNTPSLMQHVESLLDTRQASKAKALLIDDDALLSEARQGVSEGQAAMLTHNDGVALLHAVMRIISEVTNAPKSPEASFELVVRAFRGPEFIEQTIQDLGMTESLEGMDYQSLSTFLTRLETTEHPLLGRKAIQNFHSALKALQKKNSLNYRTVTTSLLSDLTSILSTSLIDPRTLFMREGFIYDLKLPLAMSFTPTPRYALERALDAPADYLGCECCTTDNVHPPTSILWKLWCEAGGVVNVRDLWEAFKGTLVPENENENEEELEAKKGGMNERMAMALFYRGLAELRMLGFVKSSKKKPGVECLAKTAWRGM